MSEHVSYLTGGTNQTTIDGASRIATAIYSRSGVLTYNDLAVTQRGAGADRSVDISAGQIVIGRGDYTLASQDSYFFGFNTATYNLSLDTNTSGNSLITSIVAYIDTSMAVPDDNDGALKFIEVKGTPAGSPTAPTDSDIQIAVGAGVRWYRLADVELDNNYSSVIDADITDTRVVTGARSTVGSLRGYTSNTTWNKPANIAYIQVEVIGAGGGGGGAQGATNEAASGGGGGAGGYARKIIPASELSNTESITVGQGGSGGSGTNSGSGGGTTSFGSHLSATGGGGGAGSPSSSGIVYGGNGGSGGSGSGGNVNISGGYGFTGLRLPPNFALSGQGGGGYLGGGARSARSSVGTETGRNGLAQGSGGSGAAASNTASGDTGGAGASGRVIITEFY